MNEYNIKYKNKQGDNMKMNNYKAVGIAEGFIECDNKKIIIKAWQHLIDTVTALGLLHKQASP